MRLLRIFNLNFQYLLSHRGRPLVYVFTYIFGSLMFLAFMRGIFQGKSIVENWNLSQIISYYLLIIPAAGTLMTHPEHPIIRDDIERGELAGRLLKPFSYYWQRFFIEIPVRIFQSITGIVVFLAFSYFFGNFLKINLSPQQIILFLLMLILAFMICFTFKMLLAIVALWTTDIRGIREFVEVLIIVFGGYVMPINLLPNYLEKFAYFTPFPYIIYFPLVGLLGKLSTVEMLKVIGAQALWLIIFGWLFRHFWRKGLMRFTDLGH